MVRCSMSLQAKRELLARVAPRYREVDHKRKRTILDEFVAATGYARKYAIRLLGSKTIPIVSLRRPRERRYGKDVQAALVVAWAASNYICAKRLVPFLPELVSALERHDHLTLGEEVRARLLMVSPSTADRILRQYRRHQPHRGIGTTRKGILLKHQVKVRTFADWADTSTGFMEADLVAHCGYHATGSFLHTLVVTDVATGWIECLPLLYRTQEAVIQALGHIRYLLPMPLLGLDTDNGSEFLNRELIGYCEREHLTFTRGRAYRKNDQCFVEQKNGSVVRQIVGYDRFEGECAYRQLNELYRAVRLYVNFFQPSMKLRIKSREGGRVRKSYDTAQTPFQRLLNAGVLDTEKRERLGAIYTALDPVELLRQLEALQDALWRHAVIVPYLNAPGISESSDFHSGVAADTVRFQPGVVTGTENEAAEDRGQVRTAITLTGSQPGHRKYRRTPKPRKPHTWRTRPDAFEGVWDDINAWLAAYPEMTARSMLSRLQHVYPGRFPDSQLRTLQRRVKEWRARSLLQFDDRWLSEELLIEQTLPWPLRAAAEGKAETGLLRV
jgi:hypothetical protein